MNAEPAKLLAEHLLELGHRVGSLDSMPGTLVDPIIGERLSGMVRNRRSVAQLCRSSRNALSEPIASITPVMDFFGYPAIGHCGESSEQCAGGLSDCAGDGAQPSQ